jgi:glutaredoxin
VTKILIFILAMIACGNLQAEIYTWKDAQGRTHFGDRPPSDSRPQQLELEINTIRHPQIQPLDSRLASARQVTIYTTEWCGICNKAKKHFKHNQIPFREYDVEKSTKGRQDYRKLNGTGVPIILVGEQRMNGFTAERFDRLYQQP